MRCFVCESKLRGSTLSHNIGDCIQSLARRQTQVEMYAAIVGALLLLDIMLRWRP